ncbi:MAG: HNH endonuclease, partial [Bacteroidetes bacterium]|nr:HNH endonuclease [Bacteroidota bacterium]
MDGRALLLNASFQPLQVIPWQKALQLFFSGKVEIVESSDQLIRSVTLSI